MTTRLLLSFGRRKDGLAAVEFALVLPMMILAFFGMLEGSDLLTVKRRIANASNALADIVTQEPTITVANINDSITGVRRQLEPTDTSTLSIRVVSVIKGPNPGDPATVHWSLDNTGGEPYAPGDIYLGIADIGTVRADASVVVVEMDYDYVTSLGGHVFQTPFDFKQLAKRFPRKSSRVQLCQTSDPATCTS